MHAGSREPARGSGRLMRRAGLGATVLVLMLAPASSQTRGPSSVAPVAEKLIDAVVNISTSQTLKGPEGVPLPKVPKGAPFEEFFEDFFNRKGGRSPSDRKVSSLGSGFVIDGKEGIVVTNNHVIEGADEIIVNFNDGSKLKVDKVLGKDTKTDLALLKVSPKKPLPAVAFGSSTKLRVGDWVMAIGNPFGLGGSVTVGIISAKQRDINSGPYDDYLQTDAAINKGNSGGPLFNMDGEVIGVNTAIISPTGGSIGIGFAVPSDTATVVIDQLRQFGETRRGWLGVKIQTITDDIAEASGVKENSGALVASVTPGSPAAKAGIQDGDVILKFDGKDVTSMRGLPRLVAQTPIGKDVDVELLRKGQKLNLKVAVGPAGRGERARQSLGKGGPQEQGQRQGSRQGQRQVGTAIRAPKSHRPRARSAQRRAAREAQHRQGLEGPDRARGRPGEPGRREGRQGRRRHRRGGARGGRLARRHRQERRQGEKGRTQGGAAAPRGRQGRSAICRRAGAIVRACRA
jgi:serine protease Do